MTEKMMTPQDVANYAGLDFDTVKRFTKDGRGPAFIRISPRVTRYRREDVDAWIASWHRGRGAAK